MFVFEKGELGAASFPESETSVQKELQYRVQIP